MEHRKIIKHENGLSYFIAEISIDCKLDDKLYRSIVTSITKDQKIPASTSVLSAYTTNERGDSYKYGVAAVIPEKEIPINDVVEILDLLDIWNARVLALLRSLKGLKADFDGMLHQYEKPDSPSKDQQDRPCPERSDITEEDLSVLQSGQFINAHRQNESL